MAKLNKTMSSAFMFSPFAVVYAGTDLCRLAPEAYRPDPA